MVGTHRPIYSETEGLNCAPVTSYLDSGGWWVGSQRGDSQTEALDLLTRSEITAATTHNAAALNQAIV